MQNTYELDFFYLLHLLKKRAKLLFGIFSLIFMLGIIYSLTKEEIYESNQYVYTNVLSKDECDEYINYFNTLIENKDYDKIVNATSLTENEIITIKNISLSPVKGTGRELMNLLIEGSDSIVLINGVSFVEDFLLDINLVAMKDSITKENLIYSIANLTDVINNLKRIEDDEHNSTIINPNYTQLLKTKIDWESQLATYSVFKAIDENSQEIISSKMSAIVSLITSIITALFLAIIGVWFFELLLFFNRNIKKYE